MDNSLIYKITKYIESESELPKDKKFAEAFVSREYRISRFFTYKKILVKRIADRSNIDNLKSRNIIKNPIDFKKIHTTISCVIGKQRPTGITLYAVPPCYAAAAKIIEFELKKKILEIQMGLITNRRSLSCN